jgi:hypothetical protein
VKRFIKNNNLPPARIGLGTFAVYWLLFDRLEAPAWLYGATFTVLGLLCLGGWISWFMGQEVDLLGNDKEKQ